MRRAVRVIGIWACACALVAVVNTGCDSSGGAPAEDEPNLGASGMGGGGAPNMDGGVIVLPDGAIVPAPGTDGAVPNVLEDGEVPLPTTDGAIVEIPHTVDPGTADWEPVAADAIAADCLLDPALLADADVTLNAPWAIFRYGRLCYLGSKGNAAADEAWSTTKTLGALVTGMVAYQTRDLVESGPKTGPFSDDDLASHWLNSVPYNAQARVSHVLAMTAHSTDLSFGKKTMVYDTVGTNQINTLSDMLNAAIAQDTTRLGTDLEQFTQRFLFQKLGMKSSSWSTGAATKVFAYTWSSTVKDMARVGLLMLNGGMWNGQRLLEEAWIYRMTHPAYEDANTGYGYLTWLNATSNHHFGGIPFAPVGMQQAPASPGACAPVALHDHYPHESSGAQNCNYSTGSCDQMHDVGVWNAVGMGGQVIQGHPGLDLLIVTKNLTPGGTGPTAPAILWDAVRPAVIAADPTFAGDETAFCEAYGSNSYAPDLR